MMFYGSVQLLFDEELNWYILDEEELKIYGTVSDLKTSPAINLISRSCGLNPERVRDSVLAVTGEHAGFQRQVSNLLHPDDPRIRALADQLTEERSFGLIYKQDLELLTAQEREHEVERVSVVEQIMHVKKSRFLAITLGGGDYGTKKDQ